MWIYGDTVARWVDYIGREFGSGCILGFGLHDTAVVVAVDSLGETFDLYQRAMASSTRVLDVLNTPHSLSEGDFVPEDGEIVNADLAFNSVTFAYPGRDDVFRI